MQLTGQRQCNWVVKLDAVSHLTASVPMPSDLSVHTDGTGLPFSRLRPVILPVDQRPLWRRRRFRVGLPRRRA